MLKDLKELKSQMRIKKKKYIPLGQNGKLKKYAKISVFFVSGANAYTIGQSILVEGGIVKAI